MAIQRHYWCILGISVGFLCVGSCIGPLFHFNRVVIVDREYFITFPIAQSSEDTEPKLPTAPTSAVWRKLSDLEEVQREHWDVKTTGILVYPLAAHGPEFSQVMELIGEVSFVALFRNTPLTDLQTPQERALLNSLPAPPE